MSSDSVRFRRFPAEPSCSPKDYAHDAESACSPPADRSRLQFQTSMSDSTVTPPSRTRTPSLPERRPPQSILSGTRMPVSISKRISQPQCQANAEALRESWQETLKGVHGNFEIQHGADAACAHADELPYNGGLWIVALPRGCNVFVSNAGNRIDYAGAGNIEAYRGGCTCGHGHCI